MKPETLFETFDQIADAPNVVAMMRDIVYSIAIAAEKWPHESLASVSIKITDGTHHTPRYVENGIPFVSVKDFRKDRSTSQLRDLSHLRSTL